MLLVSGLFHISYQTVSNTANTVIFHIRAASEERKHEGVSCVLKRANCSVKGHTTREMSQKGTCHGNSFLKGNFLSMAKG